MGKLINSSGVNECVRLYHTIYTRENEFDTTNIFRSSVATLWESAVN